MLLATKGNFNIKTNDGRLMLGMDVDLRTAEFYLSYYRKQYRPGKPYPNGRGTYPDFGFEIVERVNA